MKRHALYPILALLFVASSLNAQMEQLYTFHTTTPYTEHMQSWLISRRNEPVEYVLLHRTENFRTYSTFPEQELICSFDVIEGAEPLDPSQRRFDFDDGWESRYSLYSHEPGTFYRTGFIANEPGYEPIVMFGLYGSVIDLGFIGEGYEEPPTTPIQFYTAELALDSTLFFTCSSLTPGQTYYIEQYHNHLEQQFVPESASFLFDSSDNYHPYIYLRERRWENVYGEYHYTFIDVLSNEVVWQLNDPNTSYSMEVHPEYEDGVYNYYLQVMETQDSGDRFFKVYRLSQLSSVHEDAGPELVKTIRLSPAYPNPFNGQARIEFNLVRTSHVRVKLFNNLGQEVAILQEGKLSSGPHTIPVDATSLASGTYFYQVSADGQYENGQLVLVK